MSMTPSDYHYTDIVLEKCVDKEGNIEWEKAYEDLAKKYDEVCDILYKLQIKPALEGETNG